ncbi:hypothetical protein PCANC_13966 [Puccinia coronata f. sp. avenae]|uniref:Uncharacterized protein n=1 Tax=Puccinia coronata f. sp. avenae TaxID=200324 RepID=A0A2N5SL33_9BASI|nr:hypothetical protein PCANC_13966 [Puccinia coronata f. sp. avenae]
MAISPVAIRCAIRVKTDIILSEGSHYGLGGCPALHQSPRVSIALQVQNRLDRSSSWVEGHGVVKQSITKAYLRRP